MIEQILSAPRTKKSSFRRREANLNSMEQINISKLIVERMQTFCTRTGGGQFFASMKMAFCVGNPNYSRERKGLRTQEIYRILNWIRSHFSGRKESFSIWRTVLYCSCCRRWKHLRSMWLSYLAFRIFRRRFRTYCSDYDHSIWNLIGIFSFVGSSQPIGWR